MRYSLATAILVSALALPLGAANAQIYSNEVMARCNQAVGQYKFEGYPAERNRDVMMRVCQANGGSIPGAGQDKAVSLHRAPARHH